MGSSNETSKQDKFKETRDAIKDKLNPRPSMKLLMIKFINFLEYAIEDASNK